MKILITGNMGYVGPIVSAHLKKVFPDALLFGYDTGFFGPCLTHKSLSPERPMHAQFFSDVRKLPDRVFEGVHSIIHLAAISNDPMGARFEKATFDVNFQASVEIARKAFEHGVERFVFASSCSIYGQADEKPRTEMSPLNPLTAYAQSKARVEKELAALTLSYPKRVVTALRFATACGMSDRLRLDLVLNDFVMSALTKKEISVLSNGSPWRPLIHVKDMARSIEWALTRDPRESNRFLAINAGSNEWNYQVKDLAEAVEHAIPGVKVSINASAPPDKRSYRVNFDLFRKLAPHHQPQVSLDEAIYELKEGIEKHVCKAPDFQLSNFMRLKVLERHIEQGRLTEELYWKEGY